MSEREREREFVCEGWKRKEKEAGKTGSLGGLPLKFMIVLNICRPLQHNPGVFTPCLLVGFGARLPELQLTACVLHGLSF